MSNHKLIYYKVGKCLLFVTYQVPPVSLENGLPPKTRAAFPKAAIVPAWVSVQLRYWWYLDSEKTVLPSEKAIHKRLRQDRHASFKNESPILYILHQNLLYSFHFTFFFYFKEVKTIFLSNCTQDFFTLLYSFSFISTYFDSF